MEGLKIYDIFKKKNLEGWFLFFILSIYIFLINNLKKNQRGGVGGDKVREGGAEEGGTIWNGQSGDNPHYTISCGGDSTHSGGHCDY